MAVRRIVVAVYSHHPFDGDARGFGVAEDDRLSFVLFWIIGLSASEDDIKCAARVAGAGDPPLGAVDHVVIAVLADVEGDISSV